MKAHLLQTIGDLAVAAIEDRATLAKLSKAFGTPREEVQASALAFRKAHETTEHEATAAAYGAPSIWLLAAEIKACAVTSAGYLPAAVYKGEDRWVDVRLQCSEDGYALHTGSADYDRDHRGHWGSSSYQACIRPLVSTCLDTAAELLDQALDSIAEEASEDASADDAFDAMAPWLRLTTKRRNAR